MRNAVIIQNQNRKERDLIDRFDEIFSDVCSVFNDEDIWPLVKARNNLIDDMERIGKLAGKSII